MNYEESDSFKNELERNARSKRNVMISIVFCAVLIAFLFILIMVLQYQDSITEKFFLNKNQIKVSNAFYKEIEGDTYINIKELGTLLGYKYTKGVYGEYNEYEDSGYLQNDFEVLAVTAGSDKFTKYIEITPEKPLGSIPIVTSKHENGYFETFKIDKPVKYEDGMLYAHIDYISTMFNVQFNWEQYRKNFYSLDFLVEQAKGVMAPQNLIDISKYYENLKALNYGYIIMGDSLTQESSTRYGVYSLMDGSEIISMKYQDIVYIENSGEFYITVANGTVGILDNEGKVVIGPSVFEEISLIDQDQKIYLVREDDEYGVLDKNGNVIVYAENDRIGMDTAPFKYEDIESSYLFFDKCIPVQKNGNFGLYDVTGKMVLDVVYDGFGYNNGVTNAPSGAEQSALLIPSYVGINGIVVNLDDKYGIYDVNVGALILPTVFDKIYSITESGEKTYYISYNGEEKDLSIYLIENGLNNVDESGKLLTDSEPIQDNSRTTDEATDVTTDETVEVVTE